MSLNIINKSHIIGTFKEFGIDLTPAGIWYYDQKLDKKVGKSIKRQDYLDLEDYPTDNMFRHKIEDSGAMCFDFDDGHVFPDEIFKVLPTLKDTFYTTTTKATKQHRYVYPPKGKVFDTTRKTNFTYRNVKIDILSNGVVFEGHLFDKDYCEYTMNNKEILRLSEVEFDLVNKWLDMEGKIAAKKGDYTPRETTIEYDLEDPYDMLVSYGYIASGDRLLSPDSESGIPGVIIFEDGCVYSHHSSSSDWLADGSSHDAFDIYAHYEHNGDKKAAHAALKGVELIESGFAPIGDDVTTLTTPQYWFDKGTEKYCVKEPSCIRRYSKQSMNQIVLSAGGNPKDVKYRSLDSDYDPTAGEMIDKDTINLFRPAPNMLLSGVETKIPHTIKLLLDNVFVEDKHQDAFINWLAYIYQTRKKTGLVWVLKGTQGSGKGLLTEKIMHGIFEHNMVCNLTDHNMESQFNGIMEGRMIVHFNEIGAESRKSRLAVKNRLKTWAVDDHLLINEKGIKNYTVKSFTNIIINTNELVPVDIDADDRRFTVMETGGSLTDTEWFSRGIVKEMVKEVPAFAKYLSNVEVDVEAVSVPIMTDAKANIVTETQTTDKMIADALKAGDFDFFMDGGLEEYIEKVDGFYDAYEIERELERGEISNRNLSMMISCIYGREITPHTWSKIVMRRHKVGKTFQHRLDGKMTRGWTIQRIPF